jgi:hypothetical protein
MDNRIAKRFPVAMVLILSQLAGGLFSTSQPVQGLPEAPGRIVNLESDQTDANPGDGRCDINSNPTVEDCTLRAAIMESNANSIADVITFAPSVENINPPNALPSITGNTTTIRATSHTVTITGPGPAILVGLSVPSDNNIIQGLVILNYPTAVSVSGEYNLIGTDGDGTEDIAEGNTLSRGMLAGLTIEGDNNTVAGNKIGTTPNGNFTDPNGTGVHVAGDYNIIGTNGDGVGDANEGNLISGNTTNGVLVTGKYNRIAGNLIGTDLNGSSALANGSNGVRLQDKAIFHVIGTNGDGVGDADEGNLISGNLVNGIDLYDSAINVIAGNSIGTNIGGTSAIANGGSGITIVTDANANRIGTDGDGVSDAVEGNLISGNAYHGIEIIQGSNAAVVAGNTIGTNADGTAAIPNGEDGINTSSRNHRFGTDGDGQSDSLEGNLISGNSGHGIDITGSFALYNTIAGNKIGTNAAGDGAIPNYIGIYVNDAFSNTIGTDGDGNGDQAESNLISGNTLHGVNINWHAGYNTVAGNYIGTNAAGTAPLPNGSTGVKLSLGAERNIIGTDGDGQADETEGNLISGNGEDGVYISGSGSDHNVVAGNAIGTNAAGDAALGNGEYGVLFSNLPKNNLIGSDMDSIGDSAELNLISGNGKGGIYLRLNASQNLLVGNYIGTDSSGTAAIPNGTYGVLLDHGVNFIRVRDNRIAYNTEDGILVEAQASSGNEFSRNEIFANGGLGIDLHPYGVTPNDLGDPDSGPNNLQNYPVLSAATTSGISLTITGTLNGLTSVTYNIEFFSSQVCDSSGNGEGRWFLGEIGVNTGVDDDVDFSPTFPLSALGPYVTATAAEDGDSTSEFSECIQVDLLDPPVLSVGNTSVIESDSGIVDASFSLSLSKPAVYPVTGSYATANGSADAGLDYTQGTGSFTITPGESTTTITIAVLGDELVEEDETFSLNLSSVAYAIVGDGEATGTILDDDFYFIYLPLVAR